MRPKELVAEWVARFNRSDAEGLAELYEEGAVNHQVALEPVNGRENIHAMFQREFAAAEMVCIVENLFEDGEWAILEWRDPKGLRGCGFFHAWREYLLIGLGFKVKTFRKIGNLRPAGIPVFAGVRESGAWWDSSFRSSARPRSRP